MTSVAFLFLALALPVGAQTQTSKPQATPKTPTVSSVLDRSLTQVEREIVGAAEAMPEDKYVFVPTNGEFKGVRNFAEQVKHVAATNNLVFSSILGQQPPADTADDNGPQSLSTKTEILKYLRESFALGHRAMASINEQNLVAGVKNPFGRGNATRMGMSILAVGHTFDHYGQIVEYLRMNGIIPPASRR